MVSRKIKHKNVLLQLQNREYHASLMYRNNIEILKKVCEKSRFPLCIVNGKKQGISAWNWKSVYPCSIELDEDVYEIKDWLGLESIHPICDRPASVEVKENIARIVKPLESLYYDRKAKSWIYKENCVLSIAEQTITQGFVCDFASSRGRGMMFSVIQQLFSSITTVRAVNIGSGSPVNEPSVRKIRFKMTFEQIESDFSPSKSDSSSSDSPSELSPESSPIRTSSRTSCQKTSLEDTDYHLSKTFKFIPDVILESATEEHLLVKLKKGKILYQECLDQLRYMLMPAAVKQGAALGLLISSNKAVLDKCIAANKEVKFERSFYEFREDSLVTDMVALLTNIYYKTVQGM